MTAVLWHIEVSHYNEKARWALDYKALPHIRKAPLPGVHGAVALGLTRGGQRRLPVLVLDGETIGDSTAIVAALEGYRPEPALYPADPGERTRALALEDYFDEELAPATRAFNWYHTIGDTAATVETIASGAGRVRRRTLALLLPLMRPAVKRDYGVSDAGEAEALEKIRAAATRVEDELGSGDYLVGDEFTVADLTAASLFTPLLSPPGRQYQPPEMAAPIVELREELSARPAGAWVDEMYRRHRGESAEVPA